MSPFDPPARTPLSSAVIRALYDRNPTDEARALAWEIWRLQQAVIDLCRILEDAAQETNRSEIVRGLHRALFLVEKETCVREAKGYLQTSRRKK